MTDLENQDSRAMFMKRMLFNCVAFLTIATLAMSASADPFVMDPYVDEQGYVHFQQPLNKPLGVGRAPDELAIKRLEAAYQGLIDDIVPDDGATMADENLLNKWGNLWTEDGHYISDLVSLVTGGATNTIQGREDLKSLIKGLEEAENGINGKRHLIFNIRVQFINSKRAIGQSEFAILEATVVPTVVIATGRYNSVYEKDRRGRWFFRQRRQDVDPSWGPISGQFVNSIQDLVFDLQDRVEQLEEQLNGQ